MLFFYLQFHSIFHLVLARILAKKQVKCHYFSLFTSLALSISKNKGCILHHLAFLVWLPTPNFSRPITHFLPPKTPLFDDHFTLFSHISNESRGFYLYHFSAFLCFSSRIQQHFTLHLAPKRTAFSTKTHCIQHQNALRFAPKCTAFCGIIQ